jgi:hypothetical protein
MAGMSFSDTSYSMNPCPGCRFCVGEFRIFGTQEARMSTDRANILWHQLYGEPAPIPLVVKLEVPLVEEEVAVPLPASPPPLLEPPALPAIDPHGPAYVPVLPVGPSPVSPAYSPTDYEDTRAAELLEEERAAKRRRVERRVPRPVMSRRELATRAARWAPPVARPPSDTEEEPESDPEADPEPPARRRAADVLRDMRAAEAWERHEEVMRPRRRYQVHLATIGGPAFAAIARRRFK